MKQDISFVLNGKQVAVATTASRRLLDLLREELGCTEVKEGCGEGECGACTVLFDGRPVTSCVLFAFQADGHSITTVAGLDTAEKKRIQQAMIDAGAVQCGFCTPGFVLSIKVLLEENDKPDRDEIMDAISGNLCRCTGYERIAVAVECLAKGGGA